MSSNRRKAVTWSLALLLFLLMVDFISRALLYTPHVPATSINNSVTNNSAASYIPPSSTAWNETITEKNLFSVTRTVRTAPVDASRDLNAQQRQDEQDSKAAAKPNVILSGIIKNQNGEDVAYLIINGQPALAVRQGDMTGGLKVDKIERRKVTLNFKGETFDLTLSGNPLIKR